MGAWSALPSVNAPPQSVRGWNPRMLLVCTRRVGVCSSLSDGAFDACCVPVQPMMDKFQLVEQFLGKCEVCPRTRAFLGCEFYPRQVDAVGQAHGIGDINFSASTEGSWVKECMESGGKHCRLRQEMERGCQYIFGLASEITCFRLARRLLLA